MNIEACLSAVGRDITLRDAEGEVVSSHRAVISPLRYKNKMYLDGVYTDVGFNSEGHYLCICPPACDLTALGDGEYLRCSGTDYRIDRAEKVYFGDEPLYIWAVIRVIVKDDEQ